MHLNFCSGFKFYSTILEKRNVKLNLTLSSLLHRIGEKLSLDFALQDSLLLSECRGLMLCSVYQKIYPKDLSKSVCPSPGPQETFITDCKATALKALISLCNANRHPVTSQGKLHGNGTSDINGDTKRTKTRGKCWAIESNGKIPLPISCQLHQAPDEHLVISIRKRLLYKQAWSVPQAGRWEHDWWFKKDPTTFFQSMAAGESADPAIYDKDWLESWIFLKHTESQVGRFKWKEGRV